MTEENKNQHGGSRPGAGRTSEHGEPVRRKNLTCSDSDIAFLTEYGDNNFSAGVHRAAELAREFEASKGRRKKGKKSWLDI